MELVKSDHVTFESPDDVVFVESHVMYVRADNRYMWLYLLLLQVIQSLPCYEFICKFCGSGGKRMKSPQIAALVLCIVEGRAHIGKGWAIFDSFFRVKAEQNQILEPDLLKYQITVWSSYTNIQMHGSITMAEGHNMVHCQKHAQVHVRDKEGGRWRQWSVSSLCWLKLLMSILPA